MNNRSSTTPQSEENLRFRNSWRKMKTRFSNPFQCKIHEEKWTKTGIFNIKKNFFKTSQENMPRLKLFKIKSKRPPQTIIEIETDPGVHRTSKVQKLHFRVIPNTHQNSHQNPSYFPYTKSHTIIFFDVTLNGFWFMNNIKFMKRFRRRYSPTFPRRTFSQKCSKMNFSILYFLLKKSKIMTQISYFPLLSSCG